MEKIAGLKKLLDLGALSQDQYQAALAVQLARL